MISPCNAIVSSPSAGCDRADHRQALPICLRYGLKLTRPELPDQTRPDQTRPDQNYQTEPKADNSARPKKNKVVCNVHNALSIEFGP
jgi:hypothetical protein